VKDLRSRATYRCTCHGYLYLIDGALRVNGQHLNRGDAANVSVGELTLGGEQESDLILVDTPL
jgi:redox-sensitive bicupin YhaK (pirin superfamily)